MAKKIKFYVVWKGKNPGIYKSWAECLEQVKGFNGASFKSFTSIKEAEAAFQLPLTSKKSYSSFIKDSNEVDAACSGNPGVM